MEKVNQEPSALDAIYAAWHGAGVDIAGGNWKRFVGMLPDLYTAPQAAQPLTHAYTIELPEGDTRTAIVRFSERKADGSVMRHHLCVSVKPAPVAQPLTRSQREAVFAFAQEAMYADPELSWRHAIITATERAHGIGQGSAPQVAQPVADERAHELAARYDVPVSVIVGIYNSAQARGQEGGAA